MEPLALLLAAFAFGLLGIGAGIVTGLMPGVHVNNVALLVVAFEGALVALALTLFGWADPSVGDLVVLLGAMIVGTAVTHTFLDFLPSVFLGAPEDATALSVLPGHRLLLRGRGYEAVILSAYGSLLAVLLSLVLILPLRLLMGSPVNAWDQLRWAVYLILILIAAMLILDEKGRTVPAPGAVLPPVAEDEAPDDADAGIGFSPAWRQQLLALGIFLLSGALGLVVLATPGLVAANWYPLPTTQPNPASVVLFPLFTGLFGLSTLLLSYYSRPHVPPQRVDGVDVDLPAWRRLRGVLAGGLAGTAVAWFPGVSAASATVVAKLLAGGEPDDRPQDAADKEFMVAISAVNTATAMFTVVALFVILRARSGAAAALLTLFDGTLPRWDPLANVPQALAVLLLVAVLAGAVAYVLTLAFGRVFARLTNRFPYRLLVQGVLVFLVVLLFLLSGVLGLAIAAVATAIGLLPPLLGVRRVHLMGSLILPVILFFL